MFIWGKATEGPGGTETSLFSAALQRSGFLTVNGKPSLKSGGRSGELGMGSEENGRTRWQGEGEVRVEGGNARRDR